MLLCNVRSVAKPADSALAHGPRCYFCRAHHRALSGDATSCGIRHLTSDHHAKVVSRVSPLTATFHILRGSGDSPAQTGQSRARNERQSSLWEESLSLSPGQLGSIQSFNGHRAGDYFSLAGALGFEPRDGGTKNRCLTTWRRPNAGRSGELGNSRAESNRSEKPCFAAVCADSGRAERAVLPTFSAVARLSESRYRPRSVGV